MMQTYKPLFIVFDLDDTLYSEREYLYSGLSYLIDSFRRFLPSDRSPSAQELIADAAPIDTLFDKLSLPVSVKQSLLWMYRLHSPTISLYSDARELLSYCSQNNIGVAILTDGRLVTQSLKIKALGLDHIKSYISEEYGEVKPESGRFQGIEKEFPGMRYMYIGDNPRKDFIAPNKLGWTTVGIRYREENIHTYDERELTPIQRPSIWVDTMLEVVKLLEANK